MNKNNVMSENVSKRRFLQIMGALGLGWLGAAVYPVYKFLSPQAVPDPFGKDGRALVGGITAADVAKPGMGKNGSYGTRGLIVFRDPQGKLKAFDSKCTHAGCNVQYQVTRFYCNCHGGTYNLDGKNIAGPPPRPLTELGVVEEDKAIYVFRLTEEKTEQA
jgi:Rieske Fe-S protein